MRHYVIRPLETDNRKPRDKYIAQISEIIQWVKQQLSEIWRDFYLLISLYLYVLQFVLKTLKEIYE